MKTDKYIYKNCPIPGGGYVTGFSFHPKNEGVLYCRTDIGGTYKYDYADSRWHSLIDHVTMEAPDETFPIALALDPQDADVLYIACGVGENSEAANSRYGVLAVSHDQGNSFEYIDLPFFVHGNLNGRGTGSRLIVDTNDSSRLYMASQIDGLWTSSDYGKTWNRMSGMEETHTTFVGLNPDGDILVAAGAGVSTARSERLRGHSLFVSSDSGEHMYPLGGPEDEEIDGVAFAGHIAQRYAMDDKYLYVTYSVMGRNAYVHENGYSCDGGSVIGGRVYRYSWADIKNCIESGDTNRLVAIGSDITPAEYPTSTQKVQGLLEYGFSGICCGSQTAGLVIVSTISREGNDCIFRSTDYGTSWECILWSVKKGVMDFRTSYMKPEYNGGNNLIHWLTDLKINPFNDNEAWFNTGTGVFRTDNLLGDEVHFSDRCDGIEETVHLNLYSPPTGDVLLLDILGDLGGFAFTDLDTPCDNSFADADGNRYITCINADYSDLNPNEFIVTPRGNWTGRTKGGLIVSHDGCKHFDRIPLPYGLTDELDKAFEILERPNVNSGWVAMSADTTRYVWTVADGINLPASRVLVCYPDEQYRFELVKIYDKSGAVKTDGGFKVFADRVNPDVFYGFGNNSDIYVSTDKGETFHQIEICISADSTADVFPDVNFIKIDCANKTEIRVETGVEGHIYMALGNEGMWELQVDADKRQAQATKLSKCGDIVYRLGLGVGAPGADYFADPKAIYITASIDGEYGFYRTVDKGNTYTKLNTDKQMFGDINSLEGDSREYGRFFLATGSRGVIYGSLA